MALQNKSDPTALQKLREKVQREKLLQNKQSTSTKQTNNGATSRATPSSAPLSSNKSDPEAVKKLRQKVAQQKIGSYKTNTIPSVSGKPKKEATTTNLIVTNLTGQSASNGKEFNGLENRFLDTLTNKNSASSTEYDPTPSVTRKERYDYNTDTKTAYDAVKKRLNSTTTISNGMTIEERDKRLKEIRSELSELKTQRAGLTRGSLYGNLADEIAKNEARQAELKNEQLELERIGTFTGKDMVQFEVDDAKRKVAQAQIEASSYGNRPTGENIEGWREANKKLSAANQELKAAKEKLSLYKEIDKYGDDVNEEGIDYLGEDSPEWLRKLYTGLNDFGSQWSANYRSSMNNQHKGKAFSLYNDHPTDENLELAMAYAGFEQEYLKNNQDALDDKGQVLPIVSQDYARQVAQQIDALPTAIPSAVLGAGVGLLGGANGAKAGWTLGYAAGSGVNSYDVIRGSMFSELISYGVDEQTAMEIASDDALVESLIESGETAADWAFTLFGKGLKGISKNGAKAVASKATEKAATSAAKYAAHPLWNLGKDIGKGTVINAGTEGVEEWSQGAVSRATREKAWAIADNEIGQYGEGNIDLHNRPIYKNLDGTISTIDSVTFEMDGKYVLLPTIVRNANGNAKRLTTAEEIISHYQQTGEYLGEFDTEAEANIYATRLHYAQAYRYSDNTSTDADDSAFVGGAKVAWDAFSGNNLEAWDELAGQWKAGVRTGLVSGGVNGATRFAISSFTSAKSTKEQNAIAEDVIKDKETLDDLVKYGKEQGEGTVSERIATDIENTIAEGKEVTKEQVKSLLASNEVYQRNAEAEPTTIKEAAEGAVTERNRTEAVDEINKVLGNEFQWVYFVESGTFKDSDAKYYKRKPTEADVQKFRDLQKKLTETGDSKYVDELSALREEIQGKPMSQSERARIDKVIDNVKPTTKRTIGGYEGLELRKSALEAKKNGNVTADVLEALSLTNEEITADDVRQVTGLGSKGAELIANKANVEGVTFSQALQEVRPAYLDGYTHLKDRATTNYSQAEQNAYTAGEMDRIADDSIQTQLGKKATIHNGGIVKNEFYNVLNRQQRRTWERTAESLGLRMKYVDKIVAAKIDGVEYEANAKHEDGVVTRSITSERSFIDDTLEEALHRLGEIGTEEYNVLVDSLYKHAYERNSKQGKHYSFGKEKAGYDRINQSLNTKGYMEEVAASEIGMLFRNEAEYNRWHNRVMNDPKAKSAWQKFLDVIGELIEKINRFIDTVGLSKKGKARIKKDFTEIDRIRGQLADALKATEKVVAGRRNGVRSAETKNETTTEAVNETVVSESVATYKETQSDKKVALNGEIKGIKVGDVFVADKVGTKYKIVARDSKDTTVEISSEEGIKTMVVSNEIADYNFSNMSDEGIKEWIDKDMHIDNRTWEDVGSRKVKAFQFLFPEMKEYYTPLAQELLWDLDNTIKGERTVIGDYDLGNERFAGVKRLTSDSIARIKDETGATYDDIENALNRLINDEGQENVALAKRIELVIDEMLTDGYNAFDGTKIPPNDEYIAKKEALLGKTYEGGNGDGIFDDDLFDALDVFSGLKFSLKNKNLTIDSRIPYVKIKEYINVTKGDNLKLNNLLSKVRNIKKGTYINDSTGYSADVNADTIRKAIHPTHKKFNPFTNHHIRNLNAMTKLPELFKNAVYVDSKNPQKGKGKNPSYKGYHHFVAPVFMNNREYRALITAREKVNSNTLYVLKVEVLQTQKRHTLSATQQNNAVGSQWLSVPSDISISELVNNVKIKNYDTNKYDTYSGKDIRYSLKDSDGKTLSAEQQEYFKDSQVRDSNGNLLVVYHGTRSGGFTVFNRNHNYYTDSIDTADSYAPNGVLYKGYLNITKPYIVDAGGAKWSAIPISEKVKEMLDSAGSSTFKERGKWCTSVADIVAAVSDLVDEGEADYDGVIVRNVDDTGSYYKGSDKNIGNDYISFNSEQFKDIDNKKPTNNPDINFSLKESVEETKNLIAVHNMQVSELERTLDLGGLPMPSIAIIKAQRGHSEYGDVSLVFDKKTIDPKASKSNKVYGGDAWTPTYPKIEYKPNEKIAKKIRDKYYEFSRKFGYDESRPLYSYVNDLENQLNNHSGEAGMLEALYNDTSVMQFYLLDSGKGKVETINKETRTELTDAEVAMHEFFIKELGADVVDESKWDGKSNPATYRKNYLSKYEGAIREAYKKLLIQDYQFTEEEVQNVLDSTKPYNYLKFVRDAQSYRENGRVTVKTEADYEATQNAIKDVAGEEYRKWVDSLFKGIEEKSGIRNNLSYFTNSGNQRSWESLHWENNLENVVKVMKGQNDVGDGTFFAVHGIWGVSAKNYGSIAEIKADEDRLKQLPEEEYNKIKESFGERLSEIAHSIMDKSERNPFIAVDNAMECIIDAVRNSKTKSGILRTLKEYRQLTVTETTVDDIVSLVTDIANMPTEYFEAKPQRAVELNEIATAIIPDTTSEATKARLANMGIKYLEYEAGNEDARLNALNSLEDVKFSLKGSGRTPSPSESAKFIGAIEDLENGKKGASARLAKYVDKGIISTEAYQGLIKKYGAIPTGEKPSRDVQVPTKTAKNKKVSQTVRTILEAKATPNEVLPNIEKMVEDGVFSYETYTDKQAIADAEDYLKGYGWLESYNDWMADVKKGIVSKQHTVMGWALYNNAVNTATTSTDADVRKTAMQTAFNVLDAMVKHQRNAAQALQATRVLKKLSPETQLYGVQKSVSAFQKELTDKYGDKAPDLKIDEELAEQFLTAETTEERAEIEKKIYNDIGRQMPSRFIDKWNAWRYLAMLGNARTHVRNIFGNAFFAPVVATKNLTATAIESVVQRVAHTAGKKFERGKAFVFGSKAGRALLKAAYDDYTNVADMVSNGGKYNDSAMANQQIEEGRQIFKFKPLEWARKKNSQALETEDVWFAQPHYAYALAQYCKAHNITAEQIARGKAIAPAREYAIKEAQKATYKDTNAFSQFVSELGRSSVKKSGVKKVVSTVIEGILPFRKTPANILVRGVEYSPIGLLKSLSLDLVKVAKGKMSATEAIDNISAGLTGTGLLALGVLLAAQGLLRGHGEDDDKEKKFKEMQGRQAYSLELPDGSSVTLDWLAPEALPFFVGVNIWETATSTKEDLNFATILQSVTHITEPMLEMSCLQGVNDLIDGIGYASSNDTSGLVAVASSAATSYLMQGLPTLFGQAERTSEEERMTTYTEKNNFLTGDMQYTLGKASAKIPFWDYNQIPYIDAWGRKEASGSALKRAGHNFLNPAYTSSIEDSKTEKELLRLFEKTGEGGVFPSRADKYFTVDGVRKDLTAEEYVRYATLKGQKSYKAVTELVNSKAYKNLSDKEKADAIMDAYDYANQKAKESISNYKPQSWVAKADEFGNVGNYISFKTEVASTKEANGDKISKEEVVDIILDMATNDSEMWDMYLSQYDGESAQYVRKKGVDGEDYMNFLIALDKYDKPNKNGKLGTYTNEEYENAIRSMRGLSRQEKAVLWQSKNPDGSTKNNPWK